MMLRSLNTVVYCDAVQKKVLVIIATEGDRWALRRVPPRMLVSSKPVFYYIVGRS